MNEFVSKVKDNISKFLAAEIYLLDLSFKSAPLSCVIYVTLYSIIQIIPYIVEYSWMLILNTIFDVNAVSVQYRILVGIIAFWLIVKVTSAIFETLIPYITDKLGDKSSKCISLMLMKRMSELELSFRDDPNNRILLNHVNMHRSYVENYGGYFIGIFIRIISLIIGMIAFFAISPLSSFLFLLTYIPGTVCEFKYKRKADQFNLNSVPENLKKNYYRSILTTSYYAKELRIYNLSGYFIDKMKQSTNKLRTERNQLFQSNFKKIMLVSTLSNIGFIFLILYSVYFFCVGKINIGMISMYIGLSQVIGGSFSSLLLSVSLYSCTVVPHINYFIDFIKKSNVKDDLGTDSIPADDVFIEFKNVNFKYPLSTEYTIKNLSFKIGRNEMAALVGQNGAGKSTIVKLLLRMYDVGSGEILLNGKNINTYPIQEYRRLFSVCFQDVTQYALTLRENVALSDIEQVNDTERILNSCRYADIEIMLDNIEQLEAELTREFSNEGLVLSEGQWQKIEVARAFFRKAPFVILDEPSGSLDVEAEELLFQSFSALESQRGGIIISHRLSGVKLADKILFLKDGTIAESGTHKELMTMNGEYAQAYNMQKSKYFGGTLQ